MPQKKLTPRTNWAQANRKGFCVHCFDAGWPAILDQRDAETKPTASALLLYHKTPSPEDEVIDVLNQGVARSTPAALVALQNHNPPSF